MNPQYQIEKAANGCILRFLDQTLMVGCMKCSEGANRVYVFKSLDECFIFLKEMTYK